MNKLTTFSETLISGYSKYSVNKLGEIRNILTNKVLKPQLRSGYYKVTLCKNGNCKQHYVHRIVAKVFIANPNKKKEVNHLDGNKLNNSISNLEWVTRSENTTHSYLNNLQISQKGSRHGNSKLTEKSVKEIRLKHTKNINLKTLSTEYGVAISTISQILNNKRWKHI